MNFIPNHVLLYIAEGLGVYEPHYVLFKTQPETPVVTYLSSLRLFQEKQQTLEAEAFLYFVSACMIIIISPGRVRSG